MTEEQYSEITMFYDKYNIKKDMPLKTKLVTNPINGHFCTKSVVSKGTISIQKMTSKD
jgi:hypothetical protein